ncbi:hypothetical protein FA13DRAFT_1772732 [Coprinellus micaceus]|uniref:Uncharacterized protein n=1 Tax=Coprinellus micaceus TaxID=71717 RepID=A0A4Y7TJ63_COPMI|nr:hypothetical protein FA13DRAFT_1772732 [Coprinellus micaceus]
MMRCTLSFTHFAMAKIPARYEMNHPIMISGWFLPVKATQRCEPGPSIRRLYTDLKVGCSRCLLNIFAEAPSPSKKSSHREDALFSVRKAVLRQTRECSIHARTHLHTLKKHLEFSTCVREKINIWNLQILQQVANLGRRLTFDIPIAVCTPENRVSSAHMLQDGTNLGEKENSCTFNRLTRLDSWKGMPGREAHASAKSTVGRRYGKTLTMLCLGMVDLAAEFGLVPLIADTVVQGSFSPSREAREQYRKRAEVDGTQAREPQVVVLDS